MNSCFKTLIKNIKLTDLQKEDARVKTRSVCSKVHATYYPDQEYNGKTKLLIGSYGKHTNIRPPQDIDVLFKMPPEDFTRYDSLSGNKQSQLLQDVREVLKEKFSTTEKINAFGKVIVVNFSEGSHTVELLPAWQLESGVFKIPNTENGGSWDIWNPLAEIKNINDSSTQTGKTKTLVRILKCWINNCGVPIKSFLLEILVVNYLKEKFDNQIDATYSELILGFFEFLRTQKNLSVFSSGMNTFINLGEEWLSRTESAYSRAQKAREYESEDNLYDASLEWRKVFGNNFPIAEEKAIFSDQLSAKILALASKYPSEKEEFLNIHYGIEIKLVPGYKVSIDAEVDQNGFRAGWLSDFLKNKFPLLKGKKLNFKIQNINVPTPYVVMWKVRNFGEDAQGADGLRGEIVYDAGNNTKNERTLFHGEHYVECYIIKDNTCVAIGRVLVPIGNTYE